MTAPLETLPARFTQTRVDLTNNEFVAGSCGGNRSGSSSVQELLLTHREREPNMMSLVRLLGFKTLGCGCVTGHYREVATNREVTYVEEKGTTCEHNAHRRNHTLSLARQAFSAVTAKAS
jgi:hypothetical protein